MSFVKKTPAEFDALSEYQKEKYLDEKATHEAGIVKEQAEKAAEKIFEAKKEELKAEREAELKGLSDANALALKELGDKHQVSMDEMKAALNRAKLGEVEMRMKGFSDQIVEKLSTPEGEAMIKEFFNGQREKLAMEVDSEALKAMGVPAGGVAPHFTPIVGPGHDDFHARNAIPVFPTISNLIKFIQYTVDESADGFGMVAVGAQKPSVNYIPTVKEAAVRKIAGLLDVPDELLDDVVGFRAWIAFELPKAYLDAEDLQIFKGNGTGENLLGLWYQASYQTYVGSVTAASNIIDKIASGITEVRQLKRATTAVFVSPVEWMEILINKGTTEDYTYPVTLDQNTGIMRIGNIPIFWTNIMESGEGICGDFARGTAIFQRKAMTIGYFDQNKDNVEKNIVTIRLEGRLALPIFYPESFLRLFTPAT